MKVYIVGVDTGSPSGLLASPYMEKELNVLGYQVEQFPAKDADSLMQALMQCAQPDALILCPLSGNLPADAACIHAAAQICQKPLALNPGVAAHLVKRTKLSEQQAEQLACLPQDPQLLFSKETVAEELTHAAKRTGLSPAISRLCRALRFRAAGSTSLPCPATSRSRPACFSATCSRF